jgi:hypothetical protein
VEEDFEEGQGSCRAVETMMMMMMMMMMTMEDIISFEMPSLFKSPCEDGSDKFLRNVLTT